MQFNRIIYVYLLNEGVKCWRPVKAKNVSSTTYVIVDESELANEEVWEFHCNEKVICRWHTFSDGKRGLVAYQKLEI